MEEHHLPSATDIANSITTMITEEVSIALAPYRTVLEQMAEFLGGTRARPVARRKPRRKVEARPVRRAPRRRRGSAARRTSRLIKRFAEGQTVHFKQGRGSFEAKVVEIDLKKGALTLERTSDGKKVSRPAAKVISD